jgi:hypothetical protein
VRIGEPLEVSGRPSRRAVDELTDRCQRALEAMVADEPEHRPPGPFGRRVTEMFNEWPEGDRAAAEAAGRALRAERDGADPGSEAGSPMAGTAAR